MFSNEAKDYPFHWLAMLMFVAKSLYYGHPRLAWWYMKGISDA